MHYPIYVHKEAGSAYGIIFPDFPGCFSAADHAQDIAHMAQEAVEAHFLGDDQPIPAPSIADAWIDDPEYQGGSWMTVDIDLSKL